MPLASSLNPWPGTPPTPNAVMTDLSPGGRFKVYNLSGNIDVIVDVNGYYIQSSLKELHQRLLALEAANPGPRIAALEAAQPAVRVAHAESGNVDEAIFGGGPNANILTVNINAPAPGTLVISGIVDIFGVGAANNRMRCQIDVDGTFIGGSAMITGVSGAANDEENCATTVSVNVGAGNHTVALEVRDRVTANLDDAALWVIWVR